MYRGTGDTWAAVRQPTRLQDRSQPPRTRPLGHDPSSATMVCIDQLSPIRSLTLEYNFEREVEIPRGYLKCGNSKPCFKSLQSAVCFWPAPQLCWRLWPWCPRRALKLASASTRPSVLTATMTTHRTAARPVASMGPDISITASSSVWALGRVGVITTAGAVIASAAVEADAT
jgi:hypothetical protein